MSPLKHLEKGKGREKKEQTIVYIFDRYDHLKYKFNKIVEIFGGLEGVKIVPNRYVYIQNIRLMFITLDKTTYKLRGLSATKVIIYEEANLTQEQYDYINILNHD